MTALQTAIKKVLALAPLSWLKLGKPRLNAELTEHLTRSEQALGFVRPGQMVFSHLPEMFLAQERLAATLLIDGDDGSLSRIERELIAVVVSVENSCTSCIFGHAAQLRRLSGDAVWAGSIEANYRHAALTPRQRALADYASKLTRTPAEMEPSDLQRLRDAGLKEIEILEAGCVAAYFNMSNRLNSSVGVKGHPQAYLSYR